MITYKVLHHIPGRIRIAVPALKKLPLTSLKNMAAIPIPKGILDISPNPFTGNVVILYEQGEIDILKCINDITSNAGMLKIMEEKIS